VLDSRNTVLALFGVGSWRTEKVYGGALCRRLFGRRELGSIYWSEVVFPTLDGLD